jgi:hypothetical protein
MAGKHLSRWTLVWFGSAMAMLLAGCTLGLLGAADPQGWSQGSNLAVVHLFVLGWLCQVMLGALIQFVPVLAARPLAFPGLALPALVATSTGTLALALGFLALDGHQALQPLFLLAPVLIGLGFALVAVMVTATLWHRDSLHLAEVRMVLLALAALVGLWLSGGRMVLALAGLGPAPDLSAMLPLHLLLGIAGWLGLAACGVTYKLFAMFLLAPEQGGRLRGAIFWTAAGLVALLLAALLWLLAGGSAGRATALALALLPLLALLALLYLTEIAQLWKARRRPALEPNMLWSRAALAFLALAAALAIPGWLWGGTWAETAVFVALVGWLSTLTLAQLLKIVGFLTWIQVFAPRIGHQPVPMVQKLGSTRAASACLALWCAGTLAGALSLLGASPAGYRLAMALLSLGALGVGRELIAVRQLAHLPPAERPGQLPHLMLPLLHPRPRAETRS